MTKTDGSPPKARRGRETSPAQRALGLLVRREHSKRELIQKLVARGIAQDEAVAAVGKMTDAGWQDDTRFACSVARTRARAGYGPVRIRAELAMHALPAVAIESAFAALAESGEDDWASVAVKSVLRRFGGNGALPLPVQRKAADFLMRRGFDGDTIRSALRSFAQGAGQAGN